MIYCEIHLYVHIDNSRYFIYMYSSGKCYSMGTSGWPTEKVTRACGKKTHFKKRTRALFERWTFFGWLAGVACLQITHSHARQSWIMDLLAVRCPFSNVSQRANQFRMDALSYILLLYLLVTIESKLKWTKFWVWRTDLQHFILIEFQMAKKLPDKKEYRRFVKGLRGNGISANFDRNGLSVP